MKFLYSPSIHECPADFFQHFETFGMGPENAAKLARKLNLLYPRSSVIVLGSAAALNPELKSGQCFIVSHLVQEGREISLRIPEELQHLSQAKLTSQKDTVSSPEEKKALWEETKADLVDCESQVLYDELLDQFQDQLIIIRGVIDEQQDHLDFIKNMKVQWFELWQPLKLIRFLKLVRSYARYRDEMNQFFQRIVHALHLESRFKEEDSQEVDLIF